MCSSPASLRGDPPRNPATRRFLPPDSAPPLQPATPPCPPQTSAAKEGGAETPCLGAREAASREANDLPGGRNYHEPQFAAPPAILNTAPRSLPLPVCGERCIQ